MEYTDNNRGCFQYPNRARQLLRFDGFRYGKITPTDIDGCFDYHNELFVFFEVKSEKCNVPKGQLLFLQRICDCIEQSGKQALLIICNHHVTDTSKDIFLAECTTKKIYIHHQWIPLSKPTNVKSVVDFYVNKIQEKEFDDLCERINL